MTVTALESLLVMEIGTSVAGSYAAKLFADYGSEVHVLGSDHTPSQTLFFDASKHVGDSDLSTQADVIIQSSGSGPLDTPLEPLRPDQIVLRITPFAGTGPYADWNSTDLVDAAIGGHLRLSGDPKREPLNGVPDLVLSLIHI